jgi:hypothetical protein
MSQPHTQGDRVETTETSISVLVPPMAPIPIHTKERKVTRRVHKNQRCILAIIRKGTNQSSNKCLHIFISQLGTYVLCPTVRYSECLSLQSVLLCACAHWGYDLVTWLYLFNQYKWNPSPLCRTQLSLNHNDSFNPTRFISPSIDLRSGRIWLLTAESAVYSRRNVPVPRVRPLGL